MVQYQRRHLTTINQLTINQLKQAIVTKWGNLLQRLVDRAIGQWRRRLEASSGSIGHIKH